MVDVRDNAEIPYIFQAVALSLALFWIGPESSRDGCGWAREWPFLIIYATRRQMDLVDLQITDLSRGGSGVAREPNGRVVFVPFTAPGDRVRVRITEAETRYAQGELVEILEPSAVRQTPKCAVFGRCGGCQWQHLPYELQWKTKAGGVAHALTRVAVQAPRLEELPADQIWEYRNRVQLRGERDSLGFYAPKSNRIVPIDRCEIARPEINSSLVATREEARKFNRPYKVEIEALENGQVRKAWNRGHAAWGFRQVHDGQNLKLREWVRSSITPGLPLLDLFGGSGNLSLSLIETQPQIDCVDLGVPRERPQELPESFQFHRSSVVEWLENRASDGKSWSAILDPPREGLAENFGRIASSFEKLGVRELVAVGCDVDAWARDLSRWTKKGWRIQKIAVLDLFPQTPHVESLALLSR
jgi:23S rRNA (uracil1939-C5)-methyltransferase